jgi:hypothetical protein
MPPRDIELSLFFEKRLSAAVQQTQTSSEADRKVIEWFWPFVIPSCC